MIVKPRIRQGSGYDIFIAIPWRLLQIPAADPSVELKFNLCRTRQGANTEYSTWGPAGSRYTEPDSFGKLRLGQFNPGQGRNEEIFLTD